ncbi:unnamed protein product [Phytophthora fragariaefolia]|uniref:Unnamed protein product n=1 Tax=Phytophthora fragariaefolia TaxID=1490495 RepID=A0A9W6WYQ1_9STRA|nr:unnamed protein product [Phytophthora fragariaefolia]
MLVLPRPLTSLRGIRQELAEFEKNSPEWCTVSAVDDDLMHWNAMLAGPDSPYSGGVFNLDLQFPSEYPFKAPKVRFLTRVYHPNVKSQSGEICADIINEVGVRSGPEIAKQMHENRADFDKTAQEWTKHEAHSYVVALDAALGGSTVSPSDSGSRDPPEGGEDADSEPAMEQPFELLITQHGDSLNPSFIRDLPEDMRSKLEQHWIEERDFYWRLKHRKIALAICHSEPGAWEPAHYMTSRCPPEKAQYKVGRTMFETDRVPKGWPQRMNKMDEIWVPTKFQEKVFVDGGVRPEAVKVVPEVVDVDFFDPDKVENVYNLASETTFEMTEKTTVYLSIFKWEERKGWKVLLTAYFEAFSVEDDVVLVLLTNGYHTSSSSAGDFKSLIEEFASKAVDKPLDQLPRIHVLPPHIPQEAMPSLYKAANAFVLPSRGEGWGRPHVEAMAMERPVIATFWSGTTEYMTEKNSYPLDIDGLIEEARAKGKQAREDMVAKYSPDVIGDIVLGHITRILELVAAQEEDVAAATHEEL